MTRTLQIVFQNEKGKRFTVSVDEPIENLTEELVQQVAAELIGTNMFVLEGQPLEQLLSAKVIERQVTDILVS